MSTEQAERTPEPVAPPPAAVEVSEKQAREVAEAARESGWSRPSFAKELYLGRFDLGLIEHRERQEIAQAGIALKRG